MANSKNSPVELTAESSSPEKVRTGVLVIGIFADGTLPPPTQKVDHASKGHLAAVLKRGDLDEKAGSSLLLHDLPGTEAERVMVVSLGKRDKFGDKAFRDALSGAAKTLAGSAAKDAVVTLADVEVPGRSDAWRFQEASRLIADGAYRFDISHAKPGKTERGTRKVTLLRSNRATDEDQNRCTSRPGNCRRRGVGEGLG